MKKLPIHSIHREKLREYGLSDVPPDSCACLHFSSGEELLRAGEPIFWIFFAISGNAKVCNTAPNGKSLILCYYISQGMMGEVELMTRNETSTTTVVAVTDFECVAVSYHTCIAELKSNAIFLNKIGTALAEKLLTSSENYTLAALCSGEQRLCSYILQTSPHNLFRDSLTDVSSSVGLSYRHMFRLLGQLCQEQVLEKRDSGYYILNPGELARRSHLEGTFKNISHYIK